MALLIVYFTLLRKSNQPEDGLITRAETCR